jgi:hypothetical protein
MAVTIFGVTISGADPMMAGNGRLGNLKTCLRIRARKPRMVDAPQSPYSTISKSGYAARPATVYVGTYRTPDLHGVFSRIGC